MISSICNSSNYNNGLGLFTINPTPSNSSIQEQTITDITESTNDLRDKCLAEHKRLSRRSNAILATTIAVTVGLLGLSILLGVFTGGLGFIIPGMIALGIFIGGTGASSNKRVYHPTFKKIAHELQRKDLANFAQKHDIPLTLKTVVKTYNYFRKQKLINSIIEIEEQQKLEKKIEKYKKYLRNLNLQTTIIQSRG